MPYIHSQQKPEMVFQPGYLMQIGASTRQEQGAEVCELTGLQGLERFYAEGAPVVERCLSVGVPCAIALLDVDHLHRVSGLHGQDLADRVLAAVGDHLRGISGSHLTARLGEEEFGILLVGLDGESADHLCEALCRAIASTVIGVDGVEISITVSIGLAEIYGPETFDNYLNAAEQFLFMAKNSGRNRVFSDHVIAGMV
jgi:diguanylate cyclase (GGDEF)-like protein